MFQQRPRDSCGVMVRFLKAVKKHGCFNLHEQGQLRMVVLDDAFQYAGFTGSDKEDAKIWMERASTEVCLLLDNGRVEFTVGNMGSIWADQWIAGKYTRIGLASASESRHCYATGGPYQICLDPSMPAPGSGEH